MKITGVKIRVSSNKDSVEYLLPDGMNGRKFNSWLKKNEAAIEQFKADNNITE